MPSASQNAVRTGVAIWILSFCVSISWWRLPLDHDDQALFRLGSAILRAGGVLYRDLWDVKQPGIYWYFAAAERSFGSGTVASGAHVMTSAWLATAAVITAWLAHQALPGTRAWLYAPVLTLGTFILRVDVHTIAQVESLLPLPLVATIGCMALVLRLPARAASSARHVTFRLLAFLLAGALVAACAVFKLILAPTAAAIVLIGLIMVLRHGHAPSADSSVSTADAAPDLWRPAIGAATTAAAMIAATLSGAALVAGATTWPFLRAGALELALWTQFQYPVEAVTQLAGAPPARLIRSSGFLISTVGLYAPAAWLGWCRLHRSPLPQSRLIAYACLSWVIVGAALILAQRLSWHAYHFTLLFWPIGLLAAAGSSGPWTPSLRLRKLAMICVIAGLAVNGARFTWRLHDPLTTQIDSAAYLASLPALQAYRNQHSCRSAIIFGSPALIHALDLTLASELTGQLAPILLPSQWRRLSETLRTRPPQYIYIDPGHQRLLDAKAPALAAWLHETYRPLITDGLQGIWYTRTGNVLNAC